jgi:uncharacterized protein DUF481
MKHLLYLFSIIFCCTTVVYGQNDSLILNNDDVIVGEIKDMTKGILKIETDYSDDDFTIEWFGIKGIYSETIFLISTNEGARFSGHIKSVNADTMEISTIEGFRFKIAKRNIVYIKSLDSGFWSKLSASIDFGFNFTKASNLKQLSIRSNLGYFSEKWSANVVYDEVNSTQDDVDPIQRTDVSATFRRLLPHDWYTLTSLTFLSNTEQLLDLRTNAKLGMGNFVIHTNRKYWGFNAGASFNNEKFTSETEAKQSIEGFFGTELNLYDIGDLSLLTVATAYPSITDKGRWRGEFKFDLKYDLPLDFYIKTGFTYNYDNQPVEGASESDYVLQTSFGWEL